MRCNLYWIKFYFNKLSSTLYLSIYIILTSISRGVSSETSFNKILFAFHVQIFFVLLFTTFPMRINENSPRKWPKTHFQKLFLRINENSPRRWPKTHSQKLFISLFRIMSSVKKESDIAIN